MSIPHRLKRIVWQTETRTRAMNHGYKESKEIHNPLEWLSGAEMKVMIARPLENDEEITKKLIVDNQNIVKNIPAQREYHYWTSICRRNNREVTRVEKRS